MSQVWGYALYTRAEPHLTILVVNSSLLNKRKRSDATSDEEDDRVDARSEESDHAPTDDEGDAQEGDYHASKPPPKSTVKRKTKATSAPKKTRAPKGTGVKRNAQKTVSQPKPRKTTVRKGKQAAAGEGEFDVEKAAKDSKISNDNPLFSELCVLSGCHLL